MLSWFCCRPCSSSVTCWQCSSPAVSEVQARLDGRGVSGAELVADEKQLRQSTEQNIQLLALQFQATRCDQHDALAGHDDPKLPLITCSTDGKVVYLLDKSIIGGDQVKNATAGRDTRRDQYGVDLEFE